MPAHGAIIMLKALDADPNILIQAFSVLLASIFGPTPYGLNSIYERAREKGYNAAVIDNLLNTHMAPAPRSGSLRKMTAENQAIVAEFGSRN